MPVGHTTAREYSSVGYTLVLGRRETTSLLIKRDDLGPISIKMLWNMFDIVSMLLYNSYAFCCDGSFSKKPILSTELTYLL